MKNKKVSSLKKCIDKEIKEKAKEKWNDSYEQWNLCVMSHLFHSSEILKQVVRTMYIVGLSAGVLSFVALSVSLFNIVHGG